MFYVSIYVQGHYNVWIPSHLIQSKVSMDNLRLISLCSVLPRWLLFSKSTWEGSPDTISLDKILCSGQTTHCFFLLQIETNTNKNPAWILLLIWHTSVQKKQLNEIFHQDSWNWHEVTAFDSGYLLIFFEKMLADATIKLIGANIID